MELELQLKKSNCADDESNKPEDDSQHNQPQASLPDGGWGWVIVFCCFMIQFIILGALYSYGVFYVQFLEHFKEDNVTTSWVSSIALFFTLSSGAVSSGLVNKIGLRLVVITGSLLATFGLALSSAATNIYFLFISMGLLTGAGFGLMFLPSIVGAAFYFEKKRAFVTNIACCGSGIGTLILPSFAEWTINELGWRGALLILAGAALNCCVFGALLKPVKRELKLQHPKNTEVANVNKNEKKACPCSLVDRVKCTCMEMWNLGLLCQPVFLIYAFSNFCISVGYDTPYIFTSAWVIEMNIADKIYASYLISILGISSTIARIVIGYLCDQKWINRLWLYIAITTICGFSVIFSCYCNSYTLMVLFSVIYGSTSAAYIGLTAVIAADIMGLQNAANAYGLGTTLSGAATVLGVEITGFLRDAKGSYDSGFLMSGGMIATGGIVLICIPILQKKQQKITNETDYDL